MSELETAAVVTAPTEASTGTAQPSPDQDGAAAAPLISTPEPSTLTAREFRDSLRKRAETPAAPEPTATAEPVASADGTATETPSAAPEPIVDAIGRAHDPATGKFLPATETATTEAAPAPDGMVRIELPEGHPLRERGRTHYEVRITSPEEEAELRGLLATPIKQRELKEARERVVQMEEQMLRMQAAEAARRKFEETVDPDTWVAIQAVEDVNPALAALMRRGLESSLPELEQAEFQTLAETRVQAEMASEVEAFVTRTNQVAQAVYADIASEPYFPALYQRARAAYGAELAAREQAGQYGTQSEQEFIQYMRSFIASHPEASDVYRRKAAASQEGERQRIAAEAAEAERQKNAEAERQRLTQAATNRRTNPLAGLAVGLSTGRDGTPPQGPRNAKEFKESLRKGALR